MREAVAESTTGRHLGHGQQEKHQECHQSYVEVMALRASACAAGLPQLLPDAASAWLMAVAVEVAVVGLVNCSLIWLGLVGGVGVGVGEPTTTTGGGLVKGTGVFGFGGGVGAGVGVGVGAGAGRQLLTACAVAAVEANAWPLPAALARLWAAAEQQRAA
jgi:hypothetical protein